MTDPSVVKQYPAVPKLLGYGDIPTKDCCIPLPAALGPGLAPLTICCDSGRWDWTHFAWPSLYLVAEGTDSGVWDDCDTCGNAWRDVA